MIKPDFKEQIIVFGEASRLGEVSDFLQKNWPKSRVSIFEEKRLLSNEITSLKLEKGHCAVIYIEEKCKANFGIKANFLNRAIDSKANIFTVTLQENLKNDFNFKQFRLQDLYEIERIETSKLPKKNKKLLITGGAGFIGSALVKYYSYTFSEIIIIDQNESALFYLKEELRFLYPEAKIQFILADVTNRQRMTSIFEEFKPEIIIHTAAYKHVALLEGELEEVIKNNIAGTYIILYLAETYKVEQCILLSTDKAVEPKSLMGKSKLWAEKLCFWFSQVGEETAFKIIRFGNVLGSTGSVLPLWKKQLAWKNSIIVTNPKATRFFFTLQEVFSLADAVLESKQFSGIFTLFNEDELSLETLSNLTLYKRSADILTTKLKQGEKQQEQLIGVNEKELHKNDKFLIVEPTSIPDDFMEQLGVLLSDKVPKEEKENIVRNYKI